MLLLVNVVDARLHQELVLTVNYGQKVVFVTAFVVRLLGLISILGTSCSLKYPDG